MLNGNLPSFGTVTELMSYSLRVQHHVCATAYVPITLIGSCMGNINYATTLRHLIYNQ